MKTRQIAFIFLAMTALLTSCGISGESSEIDNKFLVTFKDENGQTLISREWEEGSIPSYTYNKTDTAEWDYDFEGWSLTQNGEVTTIGPVSADVTYYAIVDKVKQVYDVSFYDESGTLLQQESYEYGVQPSCSYTGPIDTAEWDYSFLGWAATLEGAVIPVLPTVIGTASYYAKIGQVKKSYQISFYNENNVLLAQKSVAYGVQPSHNYAGPSDTIEWDYTLEGWATSFGGEKLSAIPVVVANASYYAIVTKLKQRYTVTFESNGGSDVSSIENEYGASISEPTKPIKDGYSFVAWSYDLNGDEEVTWPFTLTQDETLYANWNEQVNLKAYFRTLMDIVDHDPYSYIPETMRPTNSSNHVTATQVNYNFNNFTNVSDIKYGGFGEQWHMIIENIEESERFYSVFSLCETAINSSVILFSNYLDSNPSNTASHSLNETTYTASLNFSAGVLSYTLEYKTNLTIPFLGEVHPQIEMTYNIFTFEKAVRIQLTENNAMKYIVQDDSYVFALQYGITAVNRKAFFSVERNADDSIEGHIYEYVQFQGMDLIPACADFYIDDVYTSCVGNKASGMIGFSGYINELYKTNEAELLGYEIRETFAKWGFESTYHTLWFNLNNISGITSVKAVKNDESTYGLGGNNNHNIYLNGNTSIFEPTYNTKLSRKYDVELRKQYFYGYSGEEIVTYETSIPMMFIQADHDGYTNFSDFSSNIKSKSNITASVTLASTYLNKIQSDYASLIDIFIENLELVTCQAIADFIG